MNNKEPLSYNPPDEEAMLYDVVNNFISTEIINYASVSNSTEFHNIFRLFVNCWMMMIAVFFNNMIDNCFVSKRDCINRKVFLINKINEVITALINNRFNESNGEDNSGCH